MKFSRTRLAGIGVIAVTAALALTGCSGTKSSDDGSSGGGTLRLGALSSPASQAADAMQWGNTSPYAQAVYDTLLHADAKNDPTPWLAKSWTYNEAKTVLTLKLRDDVTFTDDSKFTADVAAQNLLRFKKGTAPDASHLANLSDAKAVDATTLELDLTQPDPAILTYLTQAPGLMESAKAFDSKTISTVPVGSGPYVLDSKKSVVGSSYTYTKNPHYFAKSSVKFSKLVITVLSNAQTETNAVKGGQVDGVVVLDNSIVPQLTGAGFTTTAQNLDWQGLMLFDRGGKQTPALADVRVRQAINYAIDRKAMLKVASAGYGTVTSSMFPNYSQAYDPSLTNYYDYDPAKAKELLKAAGYGSGFTLNLPRFTGFGESADTLVQQYLKKVGITVTLTNDSINNAVSDLLAPKYSAAYFALQMDVNPYQSVSFSLTKDATFNPYHYSDPKVEAWAKVLQTGSTDQVTAAAKAINRYVVEQAWNDVWYQDKNTFAFSSKLKVVLQPANAYPYLYNIQPKG